MPGVLQNAHTSSWAPECLKAEPMNKFIQMQTAEQAQNLGSVKWALLAPLALADLQTLVLWQPLCWPVQHNAATKHHILA